MTAFRVTPAELLGLSQQVHGTAGSIESELARPAQPGAADQRHLDRRRPRTGSRACTTSGTAARRASSRPWPASASCSPRPAQSYDEAERRIAGSFAGPLTRAAGGPGIRSL